MQVQLPLLTDRSEKLSIASNNVRLFPHQEAILQRLVELESKPRNDILIGVLSDPPGCGKTYPLIALMLHEKRSFGQTQNLIVVPNNIHEQWLTYIKNFAGDELKVKSLINYGEITRLLFDARVLYTNDIILTTASTYQILADTMKAIKGFFNRVIIDEVDTISFFTKNQMPCQACWLVSGTIDLLDRGGYNKLLKSVHIDNVIKCSPDYVRKSIKLMEPLIINHRCFNEFVHLLDRVISDKTQLLYALDYSDIKLKFNSKTVNNAPELCAAVYTDYALEKMSLQASIKSLQDIASWQPSAVVGVDEKVNKNGEKLEHIPGLDEKGKRYLIVDKNMKIMTSFGCKKYCLLCSHNLSDKVRVKTGCCKTRYHQDCLESWLRVNMQCPQCEFRVPKIKDPLATIEYSLDEEPVLSGIFDNDLHLYKDKIHTLSDIFDTEKETNTMKMVIFSDYVSTFIPIKRLLESKDIKFTELEGNQDLIAEAIETYKKSSIPVLLVHAKDFGAGLNLENANSIILMHKTIRYDQIIGRSQRFGRVGRLTIHNLLYLSEGSDGVK